MMQPQTTNAIIAAAKSQVAGVASWCSPRVTPPRAMIDLPAPSSLAHQLRQLGDIRRNPPRLIFGERLGGGTAVFFVRFSSGFSLAAEERQ
jgi:hypothetical protein